MTSEVALQDNVSVKVKTERIISTNCAGNGRVSVESMELNRSANVGGQGYNQTRQQLVHRDETIQGAKEFTQIKERTRIIVKQEPVDDETYSSGYGSNRFQSRDDSVYAKELPGNIKAEHLTRESRPESTSHPHSPTRPVSIRRSSASSRETESRLFSWPSEGGMTSLRLEAVENRPRALTPHTGYLSYPDKRAFSRFQSPQTMTSERQRHLTARMKDDFAHHERQQTLQQKQNKGLSSVFGNISVELRNDEEYSSRSPRVQDSSPPGRTEQNGSTPEKNGSTRSKEKENSSYSNKKEEEPVWKTYQWYRDRKRPYNQQSKRHKTEPTIFMQYNEIRDKRVKDGRVVNDKMRFSGPGSLENSKESELPSSSSHNITPSFQSSHAATIQNGADEHPGSSPTQTGSYSIKRRKLSHNSTLFSGENRHLKGDGRADFPIKRHTAHYYNSNSNREDIQLVDGDENGNFEKDKPTQSAGYRYGVEPRNSLETPANDDEVSTAHKHDDELEEISSTTYEDDIDVLPDTFRHCPQDVAKILRLSRIVNAVRNNRKGQPPLAGVRKGQHPAEKMKQWEVNSGRHRFHDGDEYRRMTSVERHEALMEYKSDSDQDVDREYERETKEKPEVERNPNENYISLFCADGDQQQEKYRQMKRFEMSPDFPGFTHSSSDDQDSLFAGQMNALDDDDPVCQVNGLLSLPGFKETKFNISLGELKRRMNPPETLTRVEMISYLRQAKSSGRVLLDRNNIVTANRSHPTILSRVCENEAQVLADGILKMNREYLPLATLARKTVETYKDEACKVENCEDCRLKLRRRIVDVEITRNSLKELHKVIEKTKKEDGFPTFELASHTFGVTNILNNISLLDDYFKLLLLTLQDE